ncbi:proline-rich receptor-like protein kinase PERK2 [Iris pallida]|uniref:Proline-rich receptor-like protein kinase PERK2 n=1 Tax=Iris pallida TaxID=29817 RepID=A0AAX6H5K5_IRIPA|nr:proline-rich receptor-like protein kinase PERK2 [Iris pallida]
MTMAGTTVAGTAVRLFWPGRTLGPCDSFYADDGGGGMVAVVFCDDDDDVVMVGYFCHGGGEGDGEEERDNELVGCVESEIVGLWMENYCICTKFSGW